MKRLFLIRHCNAEGQHKDSPLTREGVGQAYAVADFLEKSGYRINRVISSPFLWAVETIKPYAERNQLSIEIDDRLEERMVSEEPIDDWLAVLEESFADLNFKLPGGESSNDARLRVNALMEEVRRDEKNDNIAIVTHGNLLALLLKEYQEDIGFTHWKGLTNPDIYLIQDTNGHYVVERMWDEAGV